MPTFLLAPDSLKGSLSADQACRALERGVLRACNALGDSVHIMAVPLADGGEGTVDALLRAGGGERQTSTVRGPLGEKVEAVWATAGPLAIIEMAQASGLTLVPASQRNALHASSFGTGQLIRAALDAGYRDLLIGIGGSATTDGGAGALQALGMRFLDGLGNELLPGGAALAELAQIDVSGLHPALCGANLRVLCDVTNPLCGAEGAAYVYGPQKGASPRQARQLDLALNHFADVVASTTGRDERQRPGSGAAGGMGFGLLSFAPAELVPGIEAVLQAADFAGKLDCADLVLTAEGAIDSQTQHGKALAGVAAAARRARRGRGVPVVAFGGAVHLSGSDLAAMGIGAALPLADGPMTLDECLGRAAELLSDAAERAVRLWLCARRPQ